MKKNTMRNFFNSQETKSILDRWVCRPEHYKIVHALHPKNTLSKLSNTRAEIVFRGWDIISTSLININHTQAQRRAINANTSRIFNGMYYEIGFELDVRPQNILGTHTRDVCFRNHAGRSDEEDPTAALTNRFALADFIFSGQGKSGEGPYKQKNSYNILLPPSEVLAKTHRERYNEILIITKPDIRVYADFPATEKVKVKSIIVSFKERNPSEYSLSHVNKMLGKLKKLNPGVPVLEI